MRLNIKLSSIDLLLSKLKRMPNMQMHLRELRRSLKPIKKESKLRKRKPMLKTLKEEPEKQPSKPKLKQELKNKE